MQLQIKIRFGMVACLLVAGQEEPIGFRSGMAGAWAAVLTGRSSSHLGSGFVVGEVFVACWTVDF